MTNTLDDIKITTKNFEEMREFCKKFYTLTNEKMEENSGKRSEQGKKAYHLFKDAHNKFYELFHWFSNNRGNEESLSDEDVVGQYRRFVDGLWDIHNGDDALAEVPPARWSVMWQIEEACQEFFGELWKERFK